MPAIRYQQETLELTRTIHFVQGAETSPRRLAYPLCTIVCPCPRASTLDLIGRSANFIGGSTTGIRREPSKLLTRFGAYTCEYSKRQLLAFGKQAPTPKFEQRDAAQAGRTCTSNSGEWTGQVGGQAHLLRIHLGRVA